MTSEFHPGSLRYPPIDYLLWAKERPYPLRFDLSRSGLETPAPEVLPLVPSSLPLDFPLSNPPPLLERELARRFGLDHDRVQLTSGTTMAIFLVCAALLGPGCEVLIEKPAYEPLLRIPASTGAGIVRFSRPHDRRFDVNLEEIDSKLSPSTRLLVLTNLYNPGGTLLPPGDLEALATLSEKRDFMVLVDEVYLDFFWHQRPRPACAVSPRFLSVGSVTKAFGLGGLRVGWILAEPGLLRRTAEVTDYVSSHVPAPSIGIALSALQEVPAYARYWNARLARNRDALRSWISQRSGVDWIEPDGGICALVRLGGFEETIPFSRELEAGRGLRVVPGEFFEMPGWLRIGFGVEPEEFGQALSLLGEAIDAWRER